MTLILEPRLDGVWVQIIDNGRVVVSQLADVSREDKLRMALVLLRSALNER